MVATIMGGRNSTLKIVGRDLLEDHGHVAGMVKIIHATLHPGTKLDALNRRSVHFVTASMDALTSRIGEVEARGLTKINMCQWISHQVMMATTEGIYGPKNPFRDDSAVQAFR